MRSATLVLYKARYACPQRFDELDDSGADHRTCTTCGQRVQRTAMDDLSRVLAEGGCAAVPDELFTEALVQIALLPDTDIPELPARVSRGRCHVVLDEPRPPPEPPPIPDLHKEASAECFDDEVFFVEAFEPPHTFLLVFRDQVDERRRCELMFQTRYTMRAIAVPSDEYVRRRAKAF